MADKHSSTKRMGEALAAIGVMASLVFVALEVRQNTAAVRGATLQAVSQQSLDLAMIGIDNVDLRSAFFTARRSPEALTDDQKQILTWFITSKLRADENRFRQIQLGTLDASSSGQLSNNMVYRFHHFAEYWAANSGVWDADFREVVEAEYLPLVGTAP